MKKLAIVGTSNSIMNNGYGQLLKQQLPAQVDLLGLGGCSSLNAVFSILTYDILDNYEYVIFDFCLNDFNFSENKHTNIYIILAYWVFILSKMRKSKTTPLFLLLPKADAAHPENASMINFYKKLSSLFNVYYIDISPFFADIPKEILFIDGEPAHLRPEYQQVVVNTILKSLIRPKQKIRKAPCRKDIQFYLCPPRWTEK